MANVKNDVKQIILDVSGLGGSIDDLSNDSTLDDLGFNDTMTRSLAQRLSAYVHKQKPGAGDVSTDDIADAAVSAIVQAVADLLS